MARESEAQEQETEKNEEYEDQMAEIEAKEKSNFKIFGLYDANNIKVEDPGLRRYINLDAKLLIKSHGRIREKFLKGKINILEILANLIAVPGHRGKKHKIQTNWASGKYNKNMKIVLECLRIIEERTKENPLLVLVKAIENGAPRDGVTVIEYGGARYPQAVDLSPMRRVSMTLKYIVTGAYDKSFNKKIKIKEALANEFILAYKADAQSIAMMKKNDSEKQADSAR